MFDFQLGDKVITKQGVIKRTLLSEYEYHRKGGKIALNLDEGDELVFVMHTHGECDLILATANGYAVRFTEANVRPMGRTARGVKGITLRGDDYVTGVALVGEDKKLITITQNGYGKRTEFSDFREMKNRGGVGVQCHSISEKTGRLCGIASVSDDDDLMMITDGGTIIRTHVSDVPTYSRTAGGVIMMRLSDGQTLVNFTVAKKADEEEIEEIEEPPRPRPVISTEAPRHERISTTVQNSQQVSGTDQQTQTINRRAMFQSNSDGVDEPEDLGNPYAEQGEENLAQGTGGGLNPVGNDQLDEGLRGRGLVGNLPVPSYPGNASGKVVIRVTVDQHGHVTSAAYEPKGSTSSDAALIAAAIEAAKRARFTESRSFAQGGTITYNFRLN